MANLARISRSLLSLRNLEMHVMNYNGSLSWVELGKSWHI